MRRRHSRKMTTRIARFVLLVSHANLPSSVVTEVGHFLRLVSAT